MLRMVVAVACMSLIGCGDSGPPKAEQHPVSGTVTVDGKPLADCIVSFVSADSSKPAGFSGTTDASGNYSLGDQADGKKGAFPGKYKVTLSQSPEAAKKAMMGGGGEGYSGGSGLPFPKEYQSAESSPKEVEVKAESNTIDIKI